MTTRVETAGVDAFMGKLFADYTGAAMIWMCSLGDRLGLFKDLATHGPATSAELAERARIQERYAREWLSALASGGYLSHDPASGRFALPPACTPVLAEESGALFLGGALEMFPVYGQIFEPLVEAFRRGGGVPFEAYNEHLWHGMERMSAGWFSHLLVQQWLPTVPDVVEQLEQGIAVADLGCGRGRALIELAKAFPRSRYVGYDAFEPNTARAQANAAAAGVADRVSFRHQRISDTLPEQYDLITTFDVVHDAADPLALVRAIHAGLRSGGTYLCLEVACGDDLEQNAAVPLGAAWYSGSVLYCLTTSLAQGGVGLGTCGLPEGKLRELCLAAGFRSVDKLPIENPFNNLYRIDP